MLVMGGGAVAVAWVTIWSIDCHQLQVASTAPGLSQPLVMVQQIHIGSIPDIQIHFCKSEAWIILDDRFFYRLN